MACEQEEQAVQDIAALIGPAEQAVTDTAADKELADTNRNIKVAEADLAIAAYEAADQAHQAAVMALGELQQQLADAEQALAECLSQQGGGDP